MDDDLNMNNGDIEKSIEYLKQNLIEQFNNGLITETKYKRQLKKITL